MLDSYFELPQVDRIRCGQFLGAAPLRDVRTFRRCRFCLDLPSLVAPDGSMNSRRDGLQRPYQPSFPQDVIHPAFCVVGKRLEFTVEIGREHDAIGKVLLDPFEFGLSFEIQPDIDFSEFRIPF